MNTFFETTYSFSFLGYEDVFDSDVWASSRRLPRGWRQAYSRPLVLLRNGLSEEQVSRSLECEDWSLVCEVPAFIAEKVTSRFGFDVKLPRLKLEVRPGHLEAWRSGAGDFLATICNECGEIHPAYWIETPSDVVRAQDIEASHPAIPFLPTRSAVRFEHGEFVGCYCGKDEVRLTEYESGGRLLQLPQARPVNRNAEHAPRRGERESA